MCCFKIQRIQLNDDMMLRSERTLYGNDGVDDDGGIGVIVLIAAMDKPFVIVNHHRKALSIVTYELLTVKIAKSLKLPMGASRLHDEDRVIMINGHKPVIQLDYSFSAWRSLSALDEFASRPGYNISEPELPSHCAHGVTTYPHYNKMIFQA
ncbi:unnamed protein product [Hermetia illucens]|uniref:Uncharacterized protein n=1 Tax=Hermetia illucens TaxID=343691 RepID=A0A7R8UDX0_HERIL|nr:unnamed protein product [Hermetia illucens]